MCVRVYAVYECVHACGRVYASCDCALLGVDGSAHLERWWHWYHGQPNAASSSVGLLSGLQHS